MFKYIDFRIFFVSLAIGIFYIYISEEYKQTIIIYPTPDNKEQLQFKDKTDNCFEYDMKDIVCPSDEKLYHTIKVQS